MKRSIFLIQNRLIWEFLPAAVGYYLKLSSSHPISYEMISHLSRMMTTIVCPHLSVVCTFYVIFQIFNFKIFMGLRLDKWWDSSWLTVHHTLTRTIWQPSLVTGPVLVLHSHDAIPLKKSICMRVQVVFYFVEAWLEPALDVENMLNHIDIWSWGVWVLDVPEQRRQCHQVLLVESFWDSTKKLNKRWWKTWLDNFIKMSFKKHFQYSSTVGHIIVQLKRHKVVNLIKRKKALHIVTLESKLISSINARKQFWLNHINTRNKCVSFQAALLNPECHVPLLW